MSRFPLPGDPGSKWSVSELRSVELLSVCALVMLPRCSSAGISMLRFSKSNETGKKGLTMNTGQNAK